MYRNWDSLGLRVLGFWAWGLSFFEIQSQGSRLQGLGLKFSGLSRFEVVVCG